uniref:BRICHOS domain-containing protein n=1 Tax=Haemonchus contortus TaxID=6289 RepID=A0A7I4Y8Z2_HAECO|nr:BRICHOS domain containing protein [Haemonchus contortus]
MDRRPRSIEQIEVIEHQIIEEGRRPIGSGASLPSYSTSTTHTTRTTQQPQQQTFTTTRDVPLERRYEYTGERDVSREPSFLHTSANFGQHIEVPVSRLDTSGSRLNTSGQRVEFADISGSSAVNNYGYDVHEVHTSEGGARVVETHGSGPLVETSRMESTRVEEVVERPGIVRTNGYRAEVPYTGVLKAPSALRTSSQSQVFTVPSPPIARTDSWRQIQSDQEAFVRKDSYRKMQQSDELIGSTENSKSYAPQSQTSLMTRSSHREEGEGGCWQRTRDYLKVLYQNTREREMTPRLLANLCCILLLLLLLLILTGIILNAIFNAYSVSEFLLYPPVCEECRRKNPNLLTAAMPSSLYIHFYSSNQAHFELRGNPPFKSNSFTAIDFETGYIAVADHALTDSNGRHFTCFIMPLDRSAIPSMEALREAVSESDYEIQAQFGWQEFWQFDAEPIEPVAANSKFTERISDCVGAKWYYLKQAVHSRDASCSDCYDFCLPDWAVVRKEKYEDQSTIGIRRLDCFRLYVPEWKNFRVETDMSGGHWQYPLASQSTKRDKSGNWVSWVPTGNVAQTRRRRR